MKTLSLALALAIVEVVGAQAPPPVEVGSIPIMGPATALAAGDRHLVIAGGSTVRVIDVSRPESPAAVGAYDFEQAVLGLTAVGQAVYVANSHDGLRRLDLADPSAPALTGTVATRGQASGWPPRGLSFSWATTRSASTPSTGRAISGVSGSISERGFRAVSPRAARWSSSPISRPD